MYVVVRKYKVNPGETEELTRQLEAGFVPLLRQVPGFIDYYWVDGGSTMLFSVNVFADRASADASVQLAADFAREQVAALIAHPPEITEGEVRIHAGGQPHG